ncbi:hypothetical protein IWX63_001188 [Arthrobacter sp. CAN_A2]|uniref:hypothetical protein n=1 Tax=Arthrobacter sp. CAN_A2 TaxID=2787718 RepID=UPI0018EFF725
MTEARRRRTSVRLNRAVAGSFLAAASAASLTGLAAAPALAAPPSVVAGTDSSEGSNGDARDLLPAAGPASAGIASWGAGATEAMVASAEERLAGVRADLDNAVLLRLVTPQQATGFYAQIERRVAAGL